MIPFQEIMNLVLGADEIGPGHDMRKFSDVPWGCWSCGACLCHHTPLLKEPCTKGLPKRKDNDAAG